MFAFDTVGTLRESLDGSQWLAWQFGDENRVAVWIAIGINGALSLMLLAIAVIFWRLRSTLGQVTAALESVERSTHSILGNAPAGIGIGQTGVAQLRQTLSDLGPSFEPLQRWLSLANLILSWWGSRRRRSRRVGAARSQSRGSSVR